MCIQVVCGLRNCIQNNMEQEEKGICIADENMVKYIVYLFHNDCTK